MTLILSFAEPRYVVQVVDRRVTDTGTRQDVEDSRIKMVAFCNQAVFSFTGLAEIEGKPTDKWLQDELTALRTYCPLIAGRQIAERATEVFKRLRGYKRLTFIGVGFAQSTSETPKRPVIVQVSNQHSNEGTLLSAAREEFVFGSVVCEDRKCAHACHGYALERGERVWLNRMVRRMAKRGVGPLPFIRLFTDLIRQVSRRLNNKWVGQSVLAAYLEEVAAGTTPLVFTGPRGPGDVSMQSMVHYGGDMPGLLVGTDWVGVAATMPGSKDIPDWSIQHSGFFVSLPAGDYRGVYNAPRIACPGMSGFSETVVNTPWFGA
jgi:hypothetical protein